MSQATDDYSDLISRRKFVKLTGVSGAAALAGCGGDSGDGGATESDDGGATDSEGGSGVLSATLTGATNNGVPSNLHVNPMATQNYDWIAGNHLFERFAAYNFSTQEFELAGLESWSFEGQTVTLTLREDLAWDTGDPVTADDVILQFKLMKKTGATLWDFADSVEKGEDDKTVVITLERPSNPEIIKHTLANGDLRIHGYQPVYEQFLDKDAAAVQQFQWEEDIHGNGPFSYESKNDQAWTLSRNDDFHSADDINFETYELLSRQDNTALQQGLMGGELDVVTSLFAPPKIVANFPDRVEEVQLPAKWGYGIMFNHDDPVFGKRKVRQAVAHVINRKQVADNAGPRTKDPAPKVTGIAPSDQESWLGDAFDSFEGYGMSATQSEKAATLLREAGYSKSSGKWRDGDGNTLGGSYVTPAGWTDWTTATNTVVDQLNAFGFDFEINSLPGGDYFGAYIESNFKMGAFYWLPGGARSSFPYFPLRWQLKAPDISGGHNFSTGEHTVPAMNGSGEMTLNPLEEIRTVATTQDEAQVAETVKRVAWHHNQNLPVLGLVGKLDQSWLTDAEWDVVSKDDPARGVKWPSHWLPKQGKLSATE
ncbi:ABC transporter substrate-binding protein [Halomicroarcula sp. F13]|uniref:ABC transporter substrate-binding protein n=1 Tax=Haloarcula rubra TaxID=2487747 RepID=A0AAW4PUZ2_9EURY|nr:ABC transporter substrate-binding protein [Halomicroarcula rubra]MBX0325136.1 ABC transporter substrate-binding protein [Halomicroarcula rubra]